MRTQQRILIIDDELSTLYNTAAYLDATGLDILVASHPKEGIESAELAQPDLILLDVMMPEMNGFEVCRYLKKNPKTADIPIVFLSGLSGLKYKLQAFKSGGVEYLNHPINEQELLIRVKSHLKTALLQNKLKKNNDELKTEVQKRRNTEKLLKMAKQNAEEANHAKSDFLARMSHEIRTPMNAILGFSEILKNLLAAPEQVEYLGYINNSAHSLLSLINDILDLSKIEAGKLKLTPNETDIKLIFQDAKQLFYHQMQQKEVSLVVDIQNNMPDRVLLDQHRLQQIIVNLLGNAVKFTEQGKIVLSMRYRYEDTNKTLLNLIIAVADTGKGIAEDQQKTIFQPFQQQDNQDPGKYGGTGLGLSITQRLVELMGGHISLKSEVGKGAIFKIVLNSVPIIKTKAISRLNDGKQQPNFAPATLLLVDDIALNRELIKAYLTEYDFKWIEASDGEQAIQRAQAHLPDLIFMDIKMPKMDGHQAIAALKYDDRTEDIPIVALTASVMTHQQNSEETKYDAFLSKPVNKENLLKTLSEFLSYTTVDNSLAHSGDHASEQTGGDDANVDNTKLAADTIEILRKSWQALDKNASLNELLAFADEIQQVSEQTHYAAMNTWATTLHSRILLFDMPQTFRFLESFAQFLGDD